MEAVEPPREPSLLERIRNMWEFANLAQWIFIFGRAVKIDENLDIEVRLRSHLQSFRYELQASYSRHLSRNLRWNV